MLRKHQAHLSYANVMASIAVFVAIGGGAYAAGIAKDSVGTKQLKDNGVKSADLKDGGIATVDIKSGAVTGGTIADGSVTGTEVGNGALGGDDVADGSLKGADIDEGSLTSTVRITYAMNAGNCQVAEGTQGQCAATCPNGLRPISGAAYSEANYEEQVELNASGFDTAPNPTKWMGWFDNNADLPGADNDNAVTVIAACVPVESQVTVPTNG
jgi:hypothetical protein